MTELWLFEDEKADFFRPVTYTRALSDLRCGIYSLGDAIAREYASKISGYEVRPLIADRLRVRTGALVNEPGAETLTLRVNARLLAQPGLASVIPLDGDPCVYRRADGAVVAARIFGGKTLTDTLSMTDIPQATVDLPMIDNPWMLVEYASARIALQALTYPLGNHALPDDAQYHVIAPARIYIAQSARIHPGVVLDASDGPIVIDDDAVIMANSVLLGPVYIGRSTRIKVGAKIYHGTSIGPRCKIGGEVEESIIQGYSNKQHDGFLGHAFIGEWCNLGADTNNSDLKNNYHSVKVWFGDAWQDTRNQFVGVFMGDHSKTGINTSINTGSVIGVGCNLFGGGLPPKFVPSFSWANGADLTTHRIDEALDTATRAMARRGVTIDPTETALLRQIFDNTAGERATASW